MDQKALKKELFNTCQFRLDKKIKELRNALVNQQEALLSETKSSAGDKHETGRAMVQLEMEKIGKQTLEFEQMKFSIGKLDLSFSSMIRMGSVVNTNQSNYFIALGLGKIEIAKELYYAVSPSSPIGKRLLGKKAKDSILFQGYTIEIQEVF
jgi:hypothetical protein